MTEVHTLIESILFVAESPVTEEELAEVLEVPKADVRSAVEDLQTTLDEDGRGVALRNIAGGWRMYTVPKAKPYLERFAQTERAARLSNAALETLAVVAYKQPVSRGQVAEIRGVDSERALQTLERRGLILEVARADGSGQAVLYGTTELFLEKLGVASLSELPPLADHVPPAEVVDTLEGPFRPEASSPQNGSTS